MSLPSSGELRYQPVRCRHLSITVSAISAQQPNGAWPIVNCLDKDERCYQVECPFTTDCGEWPYDTRAAVLPPAG